MAAAGLAGAAISATNNAISTAISVGESAKSRKFNKKESRKARRWSRFMRGTAYQDTVNDLRKAGLNPILAYTQGSSGTPSSAQATSQAARVSSSDPGQSLAAGSRAGTAKRIANSQITNLEADTLLKSTTTKRVSAEEASARALEARTRLEARRLELELIPIQHQADFNATQRGKATTEAIHALRGGLAPAAYGQANSAREIAPTQPVQQERRPGQVHKNLKKANSRRFRHKKNPRRNHQ